MCKKQDSLPPIPHTTESEITLAVPLEVYDGFEEITQVFIASSGDVNFDNIMVEPVPEPASTLALLAFSTFGAAVMVKPRQE